MSYSNEDLISRFRVDIEDTEEPYLWSEEEILRYMDEAQDDFAYKVRSFTKQITMAYVATDTFVNVPDYLVDVRRAHAPSGQKVHLFNEKEWYDTRATTDYGQQIDDLQWESDEAVEPTALITDLETNKYRLYPIPTADGELKLNIYHTPLSSPIDGDELEVTDRASQRIIMLKVHALAYDKHDSEAFNPQLSSDYMRKYDEKVEHIMHRVDQRRRRPQTVKYGGL